MKRSLAIALLVCAAKAGAEPIAVDRAQADHLEGTVDELRGWAAVHDEKWVNARETAERILKAKPDSYAGHYVLGVAMHYGEGDLARSAYHLELARKRFEERFSAEPGTTDPWRWHEATLRELGFTYGEMDRPAEELQLFDQYDKAYLPKRHAQRVWPLMKLHRYDESRREAQVAVASGDPQQRVIARSDLCAAECEAGSRDKAYKACVDALSDYRGARGGGQVEYSNASEAALSIFKYDEAERFLAESTRRAVPDSWGNPFQHLATLYLVEGRITEAIDALKGGQALRLRRPAWLDQHGQARLDGTLAELLLVVGQTDRAVQIAQRSVDRPDRQGTQSGTENQALAASALRLAVAEHEQALREAEEASTAKLGEAIKLRARAVQHAAEAWREKRRAAVMLSDEDFLVRSIRPYYVGGIDLPTWLFVELVEAVGPGVALAATRRARAEETAKEAAPFFDAVEADAELSRGEWARAGAAAERSLAKMPSAERLLRGRLAAIAAESARRRGEDATRRWAEAMAADPGVVRRLGLKLDVAIASDGTALTKRAAELLDGSPRFRIGRGRFGISLTGGAHPEACLLGPSGDRMNCATVEAAGGDDATARALVAELHRVAFSIKADLSQKDLTSLDGSPTAQRAEGQVKGLLDQLGP